MGEISISETQFAFSFFHKLLLLNNDPSLRYVIPSLRQEGDPQYKYAGADLIVGNFFFQFKMPSYLRTAGSSEVKNGRINADYLPYYRFYVKNELPSGQFNLLKSAAGLTMPDGKTNVFRVFYIAPMFLDVDRSLTADESFFKVLEPDKDFMQYTCSIEIKQFLGNSDFDIDSVNSHRICYNYLRVHDYQEALFLSTPKKVTAKPANIEFKEMRVANPYKTNAIIKAIRSIFSTEDITIPLEGTPIGLIQRILIERFDVFWIPIIRDQALHRATQVERTLEA